MTAHGIVTNVFRKQLDAGAALAELIAEARQRGFNSFELRQRALAECESEACVPLPEQCAELRVQFPEAAFNIAIEFPIFSQPYDINDPLYLAARDAAFELRADRGHLRFVDPTPGTALLTDESRLNEQARCLELLVVDAEASGVRISIEHSRQPLHVTRELIRRASALIEASGVIARSNLGICFDPCNLVNSALERQDAVAAIVALPVDDIFMFHIKQSITGTVLPFVDAGDVDWSATLKVMRDKGYAGPTLFEIAPSDEVWDNLERSRDYVVTLG